jgi:alkanesulfonate monooxygenase SsuD/methylene tetrahydromethanopterin reductase-like flavin-dependent oxidoreductase (luciferase family)/predicted kinase
MAALRRSAPTLEIPDPALVVLVGTAGSGKSHWAARHYRTEEIVSADQLRAVVGSGPADLDASVDAFALLDTIVGARAGRGLTVVVDTLGLDRDRRAGYLALARRVGLPAVVVCLDTPAEVARARNALRDRPVPARVLAGQQQRMRAVIGDLDTEGWDVAVHVVDDAVEGRGAPAGSRAAATPAGTGPPNERNGPKLVLHVASFPWSGTPGSWLTDLAQAAEEIGLDGLSLMDHLIQIPQVGRPFDPIPDPFVTLGHLAAVTSRLHLGTLVSPITWRPAASLAKAAATLDVLSGGRAFLGVGAGWWAREHAAAGLPFPSSRSRLDLLEDALLTIRALWGAGTKPYEHGRVNLPETTAYPRPQSSEERRSIPIIVGGSGERRTLAIAARLADAVNLPTSDEAVLARKIAVLRRHLAEAGRDPAEVEVTVLDTPILGADRDDVSRRVERLRGRTPAPAFAARHHAATVERHAERYLGLAAMGVGTVFVSLPDLTGAGDMHRLAAVVSAVARALSWTATRDSS